MQQQRHHHDGTIANHAQQLPPFLVLRHALQHGFGNFWVIFRFAGPNYVRGAIGRIEILESRGQMVQPVFISIDPDRDTPEILRDFTDNLHERMLGLTGSPEQVAAASKAYRTYYKKHDPEPGNEEFYLVDHSTWSYLVFPGEGLVGLFKRDETPQTMADRIGCFLDAR